MVLTAIAALGAASGGRSVSLTQPTGAEECMELVFDWQTGAYKRFQLASNRGEEKYLFRADKSGRPGLFLSWVISVADIKRLQTDSKDADKHEDDIAAFWKKKFRWFVKPGCKVLHDSDSSEDRLASADSAILSLLRNVEQSYKDSFDQLKSEVRQELLELNTKAGKLLVAIVFEKDEAILCPGDVPELRDLFTQAISGNAAAQTGDMPCFVCNSKTASAVAGEMPLEFMTQDQLVYVPDGKEENKGKAIPLCQECCDKLRAGQEFLNTNMRFQVPGSKMFFWLVPVLPGTDLTKRYVEEVVAGNAGQLSYFKDINELCNGLDHVISASMPDTNDTPLQTFTALFYYKDYTQARLIATAEGIYPPRLRELTNAAGRVWSKYGWIIAARRLKFGFGPMARLLLYNKTKTESGRKFLAEIMESAFLGNELSTEEVYQTLAAGVASKGLTRYESGKLPGPKKMAALVDAALSALISLEYLKEIGVVKTSQEPFHLMEGGSDPYVDEVRHMIDIHGYLNNETAKSVFLTGVAAGLLLEVQGSKSGAYPFWKSLNRLELDVPKVARLYPQIQAKFVTYAKSGDKKTMVAAFQPLIMYAGANIIFGEKDRVDRSLTPLIFSTGLATGYMMFHKEFDSTDEAKGATEE